MYLEKLTLPLLALTLGACSSAATEPPPTPDAGSVADAGPGETKYPDDWTPTTPTDHGSGTIAPVIALDGKVARRVSVDQLRRSIPRLFAGLTWTVGTGQRQTVGFDSLARTLGEADYVQTNTNNLDASPLFAKFMDDMAGDVCAKAVAHDRAATVPEDKLVVREVDPNANLRFLRLKLHAILVPDGSTEGIADLRQLFDEVSSGGTSDDGWTAVCVAMLTAPEMMAY